MHYLYTSITVPKSPNKSSQKVLAFHHLFLFLSGSSCSAFHNYLLCVTTAAERECSSEASYFIEEYSYRTARPIIQVRGALKVFTVLLW